MCFAWGTPLLLVACCAVVDTVPFFWERLRVSISYGANIKLEEEGDAPQFVRHFSHTHTFSELYFGPELRPLPDWIHID